MGWMLVSFVGLIAVGIVGFLLIFFWLAPQNRWSTFMKEGTARIVVRGDAVIKILIQWMGRTFRYQIDKEVESDDRWDVVEGKEPRHLFGGLRLYSLFHPLDDIYKYHQKWTHLHADGTIKEHDENLTSVFLKEDLYVIDLPLKEGGGVEDINGVPMGIKMVVPMRIFNPYIAIFRVRNWLSMTIGIIGPRLRQFVANYRYKEDLLNMRAGVGIKDVQKKAGVPKENQAKEGDDLWEKFWSDSEKDFAEKGGIVEKRGDIYIFGVEINRKGTRILEINPGPEYRRFTTMQYEAEKGMERTIIEAKAEKERIDKVYSSIQGYGDLGKLVRTLEALEKSPEKGAKWIIPLPGGAEFLRGIFGERPPEVISPQEFRELREMVERVLKEKGGK